MIYPASSMQSKDNISDDDIMTALSRVGLEDLPTRFNGLDVADIDWSRILSLGEQQRLALARLILHEPVIVFLDESTSALDLKAQRRFYEWMIHDANCSFVSVGHRPSLVQFHRRVLQLNSGPHGEWTLMSAQQYLGHESKII